MYADLPGKQKKDQTFETSMSYTFRNASTLNSTLALQAKGAPERASVAAVDHQRNEDEFLFNQISASKYQEFKVIKINARGKKQERVLAIDGYNIYNCLLYTSDAADE